MITPVVMPQLGLEVTEGSVTELFVEPGSAVAKDTPLLELETDKASTDVLAPRDGVLRSFAVAVGDTVPVGELLATLSDTADEPLDSAAEATTPVTSGGAPAVADPAVPVDPDPASAPAAASADTPRRRVAPVARRAAAALGVDLDAVTGTGPRGRVNLADVEQAAERQAAPAAEPAPVAGSASASASAPTVSVVTPQPPASPAGGAPSGDEVPMTAIRRAIARRMSASQLIPQYQLQSDVDASHLLAQKAAQSAGHNAGARIGVNDLLIQAIAETVHRHPVLAVSWFDEPNGARMVRVDARGVGLAAASDRGLVVPVIRDPQAIGLAAIAEQRQRLVAAARSGTLALSEMAGAATTLSNLGSFGVDRFTAMLNPGESAIVAVGRTVDRVVPRGTGTAVVPILTVTISFDHRVIDGADGAAALQTLVSLLEGEMAWRP